MEEIKIYVATHKKFKLLGNKNIYAPIQGGCSLYTNIDLGYLKDNIGENISLKKENYNELTSMYWAWKNSNADIKGLCHYRRYFSENDVNLDSKYILDEKKILKVLSEYDAILPIPCRHKGYTNYEYWIKGSVKEKDLIMLRETVKEVSPDYLEAYDIVIKNEYASYWNSLIAKSNIFDSYSEWLFMVLGKFENKVNLNGYSKEEIRIYGYMGELLLNVWFLKNNIKIKYYTVHTYGIKKSRFYNIKCIADKIGIFKYIKAIKYKDWKEYEKFYN